MQILKKLIIVKYMYYTSYFLKQKRYEFIL